MYSDITITGETLGVSPEKDRIVDVFVRYAIGDPPVKEIDAALEFARLVRDRGLQLYIGMDGDGDLHTYGKDGSGVPLERKKFWTYHYPDKKSTSETSRIIAAKPVITEFIVPAINEELIRHLRTHPQDIYELAPRRFETLVADLLKDMGVDFQFKLKSIF